MKYILTILSFLVGFSALGQEYIEIDYDKFYSGKEGFKEAKKAIKEGDESFIENIPGAYKNALELFLKANEYNSNYAPLNYRIGICYLNSINKTRALPFLEKAYKTDNKVSGDITFQLGRAYQYSYRFAQAIEMFNKYHQVLPTVKAEQKIKEIEKHILECKNGTELMKKPVRCFIDNLGKQINTSAPEYGPVISADESVIMFTSRRASTTGFGIDPEDKLYYEDIYQASNAGDGWSEASNVGKPLNTKNHDATVSLSPDGQRLFIFKGDNGGDIYESFLKGDSWSEPKRMPKPINSAEKENSACISFDGNSIYFTSYREGKNSYGGSDIYVCHKNAKGEWGDAINLGPIVNTDYDEIGVFMLPDGRTMYFSSNNSKSMGGFDIYKTTMKEDGSWTAPENLGYPINTPDNDVFFQMAANGHNGYYSTVSSDGFGDTDLYKILFLGPEKNMMNSNEDNLVASLTKPVGELVVEKTVALKTIRLTIVKGVVTDSITGKPIEAVIELYDNDKNIKIASVLSNSKTGRYLVSLPSGFNYGLNIKQEGYLFHSENFNIPPANSYREEIKNIALVSVVLGSKVILKNIFFTTGKAILESASKPELERIVKFLKDYPSVKIEISGHTDNVGSAVLNDNLSGERAKAVVDYLIQQSISADRLTSAGYGSKQPIANNATEEGRQLNRRVEFKITSK